MKLKFIEVYANTMMRLGYWLYKFGNKVMDYSFNVHKEYGTNTGKNIAVIQKIAEEYVKQETQNNKKNKKQDSLHVKFDAPLESATDEPAYYIRRNPKKDN